MNLYANTRGRFYSYDLEFCPRFLFLQLFLQGFSAEKLQLVCLQCLKHEEIDFLFKSGCNVKTSVLNTLKAIFYFLFENRNCG